MSWTISEITKNITLWKDELTRRYKMLGPEGRELFQYLNKEGFSYFHPPQCYEWDQDITHYLYAEANPEGIKQLIEAGFLTEVDDEREYAPTDITFTVIWGPA